MIAYLVLALGGLAMLGGIWWNGHGQGYDAAIADDKPKIERLQADLAKAQAANATLGADVETIRGEAKACSVRAAELAQLGAGSKAAVDAALAASAGRSKAIEAKIAALAAGSSTRTPAQQCEAARTILGDMSDRAREIFGFGPEPAAPAAPAPAAATPKPATATPARSGPLPPAVRGPAK